jgi:hypothetical protein
MSYNKRKYLLIHVWQQHNKLYIATLILLQILLHGCVSIQHIGKPPEEHIPQGTANKKKLLPGKNTRASDITHRISKLQKQQSEQVVLR